MTESVCSKHIILCDNCGSTFRTENTYREHECKPSKVYRPIRPPSP